MNMKRGLKKVISFVLVASILAVTLLTPVKKADAKDGKYVSEVYVAYGKNADEAKKVLEDKGFTPVEGNLNDGGKTYSMMGYKTTNEIRDSITDLAAMNMRGDYSVEDYQILLKKQKNEIAEFLNEFISVIREYRVNYKAGKTKAVYVHDLLNNYIDDDTGMKMGDLFNSVTLQDKVGVMKSIESENPDKLPDLVTILLQGNVQVIKSMEILLSMAADTADNTWLDRFAELDYDTLLDQVEDERPDLNTESKRIQYLENVYGGYASVLGLEVEELRVLLNDYIESDMHIDTATEDDIMNTFGDINEDAEASLHYQDWLSVGMIYEGLKNYEGGNYAEGEMLDFFTEENDPEDEEIFIPMAAALSEGQLNGLLFVSFDQLMNYAFLSDEGWKQYADKSKADFDGMDEISVYENIDRDLYKEDGSVALTASAQRANNTAAGTTGDEEDQMDTFSKITAISWVATTVLCVVTFASMAVRNYRIDQYYADPFDLFEDELYNETNYKSLVEDEEIWQFAEVDGSNYVRPSDQIRAADKTARLQSAHYAIHLTRIIIIVTLVIAVISAVLTIIDLLRDKSVEQLPIPKYLVDNYTDADGGNYSLNYKAVECNREEYFGKDYTVQKGSCADINADEGKQWLVLYASKNSKAGRPLTPDFIVQESNKAPSGYDGSVHLIGEKGALNVVSGAFKNYSTFSKMWQNITGDYSMYIFSKLSDKVKTYDESAGNMTASSFQGGMAAVWGFGGIALGAILGVAGAMLVRKRKKVQA